MTIKTPFNEILVDKRIADLVKEKHRKALAKCRISPNGGVNLEKLQGGLKNLFSLRFSQKGRILATIQQNKLIVLAILENHEYEEGERAVEDILNRLNAGEYRFDQIEDSLEEELEKNNTNAEPVYVQTQRLEIDALEGFDEEQRVALTVPTPCVITGQPGSGKTTVSIGLLEGALKNGMERLLYVTHSSSLVKSTKGEFRRLFGEDRAELVEFATYDALLKNPDIKELPLSLQASEAYCCSWIENWRKTEKRVKQKGKRKARSDIMSQYTNKQLYEAFRVRSGYTKEEYLNISEKGKNHSTLSLEERGWVNEAYQAFINENERKENEDKVLIPAFSALPPLKDYNFIIVDEAQDFSRLQLKCLMNLSKKGSIVFVNSRTQSITDNASNVVFLEETMKSKLNKDISKITLKQSYRCPENIMELANAVNQLRHDLTPKEKSEMQDISEGRFENNHQEG